MAEHILERASISRVEFYESIGDYFFLKGAIEMIPSIYHRMHLVVYTVLPLVVVFEEGGMGTG